MDVRSFSKDIRIVPIASYVSASSDRNSQVIDCLGFDGCCIVVHFAAIVTNSATTMYVQHADAASDENTLTSGANIATSSQSVADDQDNTVRYIDFKPTKRYAMLCFDKDATNAQAESAVAYLYNSKTLPVTACSGNTVVGEGTGAVAGEFVGVAVSGTA